MIDHVKLAPLQGMNAQPRMPAPVSTAPQSSFSDVLAEAHRAHRSLRFSAHAAQRLKERDITLSEAGKAALQEGVDRAAAKGSREALLLTDDAAFVVSVANRTVITAVSRSEMGEAVFTNIDSAVVVGSAPARS